MLDRGPWDVQIRRQIFQDILYRKEVLWFPKLVIESMIIDPLGVDVHEGVMVVLVEERADPCCVLVCDGMGQFIVPSEEIEAREVPDVLGIIIVPLRGCGREKVRETPTTVGGEKTIHGVSNLVGQPL